MHRPPSVDYPLGNARVLHRLILVAWMTVLLVVLGWSTSSGARGGVWLAGLALTGLAAIVAWHWSSVVRGGTLQWDGCSWSWERGAGRHCGQACIALDLQLALLVRCRCESGAVHWCWPTAAGNPGQWLALRRALLATAPGGSGGARAGDSAPGPGAWQ